MSGERPITNYARHEERYRQLRAEGADGWATAEDYRETAEALAWLDTERARLGAPPKGRALEMGCGAGNITEELVRRGFTTTGIDISRTAIEWARARVPGARFLEGDIVRSIEGRYDLVVDGHCLHCIIGDDRERVLTNVRDALVPGGLFFVATMCGEITIPALRACFDPITRCQVVEGVAYRFIGDADGIRAELRAAGFEVVASTVRARRDADDQDHLWALARRPS